MKMMRLVLSGSKGNSAIFGLYPGPNKRAGDSPKHDHGCNVDGSKLFKGGVSGHAYGRQPPIIYENLPSMNLSVMPEVEASSGEKVGRLERTWIIELISIFLIIVLSAGSAVSLLVQVEDGERERVVVGGGGGVWGLGEGSEK